MTYVRRSSRVVLIGPDSSVLMVRSACRRTLDGATSAWFVPGGGVRTSETIRDAGVREIREETGLAITAADLVPLAFTEGDGQVGDVRGLMRDDVFVCRAPATDISVAGLEDHERRLVEEYRWWSLPDLRLTTETVFPRRLADALTDYLAAPTWQAPVRLPW